MRRCVSCGVNLSATSGGLVWFCWRPDCELHGYEIEPQLQIALERRFPPPDPPHEEDRDDD